MRTSRRQLGLLPSRPARHKSYRETFHVQREMGGYRLEGRSSGAVNVNVEGRGL